MSAARRKGSRGFALPLVVLLALVAAVMTGVLLERQSAQARSVQRQLQWYRSSHFERGVREIVGQWTDTLGGQIDQLRGTDGHALDIAMPTGEYIAVYLFDGQGQMLSDPAGKSGEQLTDLEGVLKELGEITGWNPDPMILRPVGPVAVSASTAPVEVLTAIGRYAGARDAAAFAQGVIAARGGVEGGTVNEADLETAKNRANLDPQQRQVLGRLLTNRPTLWAAVIDVYPPQGNVPVVRYGARFEFGGSSATGGLLQSLGRFLSWEELPVQDESGNE